MPVRVQPVEGKAFAVTGATIGTDWIVVPGIVAGAAYATGDAMGVPFEIDMKSLSGMIVGVLVSDLDKEQLAFDIALFDTMIIGVADNAAFALHDGERFKTAGHISIGSADFAAFSDNAIATTRLAPPLPYLCPTGKLVAQCVARGVPNYTDAKDLAIRLLLIPDLG